jgi:hypothetical protein
MYPDVKAVAIGTKTAGIFQFQFAFRVDSGVRTAAMKTIVHGITVVIFIIQASERSRVAAARTMKSLRLRNVSARRMAPSVKDVAVNSMRLADPHWTPNGRNTKRRMPTTELLKPNHRLTNTARRTAVI